MSAEDEYRLMQEAENAERSRLRQRAREQEGRADFGAVLWAVGYAAALALTVGGQGRGTGLFFAGTAAAYGLRTWIVAKVRAERLRDLAE